MTQLFHLGRIVILWLGLLLWSGITMAGDCNKTGNAIPYDLLSSVAIPQDNVPDGTIVWRSELGDIGFYCTTALDMTLHVHPYGSKNLGGYRIGIEYAGKPYWEEARIKVIKPCPNGPSRCELRVPFSILVKKEGAVNSADRTALSQYTLFSLDDTSNVNNNNIIYTINGLDSKVRAIPCSFTAAFSENTLDFGSFSLSAETGKPINHTTERNVNLEITRNCSESSPKQQGSLFGYFTSTYGSYYGTNGDNVTARLINTASTTKQPSGMGAYLAIPGRQLVPFGERVHLANFTQDTDKINIPFTVTIARDDKVELIPGEFHGQINLDLIYE